MRRASLDYAGIRHPSSRSSQTLRGRRPPQFAVSSTRKSSADDGWPTDYTDYTDVSPAAPGEARRVGTKVDRQFERPQITNQRPFELTIDLRPGGQRPPAGPLQREPTGGSTLISVKSA